MYSHTTSLWVREGLSSTEDDFSDVDGGGGSGSNKVVKGLMGLPVTVTGVCLRYESTF